MQNRNMALIKSENVKCECFYRSPGGNWTSPNGDPCLMYDVDFSKVKRSFHFS